MSECPRPSRAESMPPRKMSRTFSTPACPFAARPQRYARPIITARAPSATAFDDVAAAADPAVHDDLDVVAHRLDHRRQSADGRRCSVEVVAAVVGHRDCGGAAVDGAPGVVHPGDALDHERTAPLLAQPRQIRPSGRRCLHPFAVKTEEGRRGIARIGNVRDGEVGDLSCTGKGRQPPRRQDELPARRWGRRRPASRSPARSR